MIRRLCLLLAVVFLLLPSLATAQQSDPLDWSEYERKLWEWPFQELSFNVENKGDEILHTFVIREVPDAVLETLNDLSVKQTPMGDGYLVQGIAYQSQTNSYQVTVSRGGLFMKLVVTPYQGGSKLVLHALPFPLPNQGIQKPLYPYRLGDGHRAPSLRYDGFET